MNFIRPQKFEMLMSNSPLKRGNREGCYSPREILRIHTPPSSFAYGGVCLSEYILIRKEHLLLTLPNRYGST